VLKIGKIGSQAAVLVFLLGMSPTIALAQDYALSLYAGRLTKEKFERAILPDAEFADATIIVAAGSWTVSRFFRRQTVM
jgi:hypothetical protein